MNRTKPQQVDPLRDLLRIADASAPSPPVRAGLAAAARDAAACRTRRKLGATVAGAGLALMLLIASVVQTAVRPEAVPVTTGAHPTATPADRAALDLQLRELRVRADAQRAVLDGWRHADQTRRRLDRARAALGAAAPSAEVVALEREEAALILFDHAERMRRELKQEEAAQAAYRRAVELFPETRWAAIARQRVETPPM